MEVCVGEKDPVKGKQAWKLDREVEPGWALGVHLRDNLHVAAEGSLGQCRIVPCLSAELC